MTLPGTAEETVAENPATAANEAATNQETTAATDAANTDAAANVTDAENTDADAVKKEAALKEAALKEAALKEAALKEANLKSLTGALKDKHGLTLKPVENHTAAPEWVASALSAPGMALNNGSPIPKGSYTVEDEDGNSLAKVHSSEKGAVINIDPNKDASIKAGLDTAVAMTPPGKTSNIDFTQMSPENANKVHEVMSNDEKYKAHIETAKWPDGMKEAADLAAQTSITAGQENTGDSINTQATSRTPTPTPTPVR